MDEGCGVMEQKNREHFIYPKASLFSAGVVKAELYSGSRQG